MSDSLHPRNRHSGRYDFEQLVQTSPGLGKLVHASPRGELTIDFSDPIAVKALNAALLSYFYGVSNWDIPVGYLCPPIPGRADYLHNVADLLASSNNGNIPRGKSVRILDVGVGANCVYPIIGQSEYGWSFVGSETDPMAVESANKIVSANKNLIGSVEIRLQKSDKNILNGVFSGGELFDASICNPPFHASLEEAQSGSRRKWKNLGKSPVGSKTRNLPPMLNFGGKDSELWYPGGEIAFIRLMIEQSAMNAESVFWFSCLISKETNLPAVSSALSRVNPVESRIFEMAQGQKKSRIVAWTFLNPKRQQEWRTSRW